MTDKRIALIALALCGASAPALADVYSYMGNSYAALSYGRSSIETSSRSELDASVTGLGATVTSSRLDDTDDGFAVNLGHQFHRNVAAEIGYVDLGKASYKANGTVGIDTATIKADAKVRGATIGVVGILPLSPDFSLTAKAGGIHAKVKTNARVNSLGLSASDSDSETKWKPYYGVGALYNISPTMFVNAEYVQYNNLDGGDFGKGDVEFASIGIGFRF